MINIEIKARKLIEYIISNCLPNKIFTITVKGEFRGLYYPTGGAKITVDSEEIIEFLLGKNALILHEKLPSSNGYPVKPTRFIVSYDQQIAENFIDTLSVGDFSLSLSTGQATYRENTIKLKPGSQVFNLYKAFLENPRKKFEYDELCKIAHLGESCGSKEVQELVNKQIKKRLKIPPKHFQAEYGYIFLPS